MNPTHMNQKEFQASIYNIVQQIPAGRVLSYGLIAALAGYPKHSRHVGRILKNVPPQSHLPCHRVVSASGRIVPSWPEQKNLLLNEGIVFKSAIRVDMHLSVWKEDEIISTASYQLKNKTMEPKAGQT